MKSNNKKLVIFDFDGVLVDTLFVGHSVTKEVNKDISIDKYKSLFEGNIYKSIENGTINEHPKFFERYDIYAREVKIPDILKEIVKKLAQEYILVIVSSTGTSSIKKILERDDVSEFFDSILGYDIDSSKIKKIKIILERYDITPNNTILITDTLGDILEAKKCEVESIGVTWGFHNKETLKRGNPNIIIDNPRNLLETIQNVLK